MEQLRVVCTKKCEGHVSASPGVCPATPTAQGARIAMVEITAELNWGVGREEARGLTHLVHRLVLVVPELVRGHGRVQSPVDVCDREHRSCIVEVVAEARVEVVSVPCE